MGDSSIAPRRVLADVSNQLGSKRRFVSISNNSAPNSETASENEVKKSDLGLCVSRKASEQSIAGKRELEISARGDFPVVSAKKQCGEVQKENSLLDLSKVPRGSMKIMGLFDSSLPFVRRDAVKIDGGEGGSGKGVDFVKNLVGGNGGGGGDFTGNKSSSIGCSIPLGSLCSQVGGAEKCTGPNLDGGGDTSAGLDLLNSCSCSFCRKAAYIWADLHYQDVKGRIAALKRSKKEARGVVDRHYNYGEFQKTAPEIEKSKKLELDLMAQWRALFLHTEDILTRESNQLQSSLLNLKELRDNCKDDLEMINGTSTDK